MTTFKVDGRNFQQLDEQRVIAILEGLPLGELLTTQALIAAIGLPNNDNESRKLRELPALMDRRVKYERAMLWGSAQTIRAFKKEIVK